MNLFGPIWRTRARHIACVALLLATGARAQSVDHPEAAGDIQWSRSVSGMVDMFGSVGNFYDVTQVGTETLGTGKVLYFKQYVKNLTQAHVTVDDFGRLTSGSFSTQLTWSEPDSNDQLFSPGFFSLSNLHFDFSADGSAQIWATATGTQIEATDVLAWRTPANAIANADGQLTLNRLIMSDETIALWAQTLNTDPEPGRNEFAYLALTSASAYRASGMGTLHLSAVPEPSAGMHMSLGLLALVALQRRRTRHRGDSHATPRRELQQVHTC